MAVLLRGFHSNDMPAWKLGYPNPRRFDKDWPYPPSSFSGSAPVCVIGIGLRPAVWDNALIRASKAALCAVNGLTVLSSDPAKPLLR